MVVASVMTSTMELAAVGQSLDSRHVVTPIDVSKAGHLMCRYGIYDKWKHVIAGLHSGFNIGIQGKLSCMYTIPEVSLLKPLSG